MSSAFWFGLLASASLLIGALLALRLKPSKKLIGIIMAFGVGALISSASFELVSDAFDYANDLAIVIIGILAGCLAYFLCDYLVDRHAAKKSPAPRLGLVQPRAATQSGSGILIGTILDGIPESIAIGLSLAQGASVSIAMIVAVFISNIPEALSSSTDLKKSGWKKSSILALWTLVILISALASLAGFALLGDASSNFRAFILAFAGGAILTMLSTTMMPTAYKDTGKLAGIATTIGFSLAFALSIFE